MLAGGIGLILWAVPCWQPVERNGERIYHAVGAHQRNVKVASLGLLRAERIRRRRRRRSLARNVDEAGRGRLTGPRPQGRGRSVDKETRALEAEAAAVPEEGVEDILAKNNRGRLAERLVKVEELRPSAPVAEVVREARNVIDRRREDYVALVAAGEKMEIAPGPPA
jgi:hypothetical protein